MSARNLGFVGCRLLAVYFFIRVLEPFSQFFEQYYSLKGHRFSESNDYPLLVDYPMLVDGFVLLFSAIVLWFSASFISKCMSGDSNTSTVKLNADEVSLQSVAISSIGLFLIAKSLSVMVYLCFTNKDYSIFLVINDIPTVGAVSLSQAIFEFVFGVFILFGAGRMSRLIVKLRTFGLTDKIDAQSTRKPE